MNKPILFAIVAVFSYVVFRPGTDSSPAPEFTQATFQQAIQSGKPVVVDFRAKWYGPSRSLAPAINQLAEESAGIYLVGKLDVDRYKNITRRYKVRRYPTVLIFKDGKVVDELDSSQTVEDMQQQIFQNL